MIHLHTFFSRFVGILGQFRERQDSLKKGELWILIAGEFEASSVIYKGKLLVWQSN